jgi:hypothetical protein
MAFKVTQRLGLIKIYADGNLRRPHRMGVCRFARCQAKQAAVPYRVWLRRFMLQPNHVRLTGPRQSLGERLLRWCSGIADAPGFACEQGCRMIVNAVRQFVSLLVVMMCLSGCVLLDWRPYVDAKTDNYGNTQFLDTPRMWKRWTDFIDRIVSREVRGLASPSGSRSWDEYWARLTKTQRQVQENPERYIGYIREKRNEAGLGNP